VHAMQVTFRLYYACILHLPFPMPLDRLERFVCRVERQGLYRCPCVCGVCVCVCVCVCMCVYMYLLSDPAVG
jgi:hypothetical protein